MTRAKRMEQGSNFGWRIHVRPDSNGTVTIILPVTTGYDTPGAIFTEDGRMLSTRLELTVNGPLRRLNGWAAWPTHCAARLNAKKTAQTDVGCR